MVEATIASQPVAHRSRVNEGTSLVRRVFLSEVPCLEGLTWKRVGWTFAFAAALGFNRGLGDVSDWTAGHFAASIQLYLAQFIHWFPKFAVSFVPLMLLATVADNVAERGAARVAAFAGALLLGIGAIPVEFCLFQLWAGPRCTLSLDYFIGAVASTFILQFVPLSVIIGAVWLAHRRDAFIAAGLHAAMMERLALQRQSLEAGLRIVQSRIEPAFLLDTLADVSRRCCADPPSAERIVDQLVLYLRATLPDVRDEGATLGRELQVAASYLELVALRSRGRVRFAIEAPDPLADFRMAPMVLMPLVTRMLQSVPGATAGVATQTRRGSASNDLGSAMLNIEASIIDHRVQVRIICTDSRARIMPDDPLLSELRTRLVTLYGASASLRVDAGRTHALACLALPHEPAVRVDEIRSSDTHARIA